MALTPKQRQARRLWKMRALGLGYDDGGGGGGGGGSTLTDQVIAFFGSGEQGGVWDFTDAANLATATDGTGAVSNGSAIAYAADLSGNGNHLLQATAFSRPTWDSTGFGSFANDFMTVNWTATAQPLTRVSRFYPATWASGDRVFADGSASVMRLYQLGTSTQYALWGGAENPLVGRANIATGAYSTVAETLNGTSSNIRVNGSDTATQTGTSTVGGFTIGGDPDGTDLINSLRVVRVLMINREITAGELATAEEWVAEVL